MDLLPVFWNIRDRKCVVIGGGEVARRKARQLLRAGARLTVIAPDFDTQLLELCSEHGAEVLKRRFEASDLSGAQLVIAATDDEAVNQLVSETANTQQVPVNVVDRPELCSFIMPAVVDRTPVVVAISTGGTSPVLTRMVKELNESLLPDRIGRLARLLGSCRPLVKESLSAFNDRLRFWESALESEVPELVYSGQETLAREKLEQQLLEVRQRPPGGEVYLVGAGPGDPDLLTLRALRLMLKADVVLYDRLVSEAILQRLRPDAEKIHVGKQRSQHTVAQKDINQMLVDYARQGKKVLRLKGGDPFIFGRGGEEIASLTEAGVPFQIIPGITAASGCAAYAGIPLTHRDLAHSVRFLPGHLKSNEEQLDWHSLIVEQQTLVFYMSLVGLERICAELIAAGMDPDTPGAVIQQGTLASQRVVVGTIKDLAERVEQVSLEAPTLTIIGEVVKLREQLNWFKEAD